jgi:hypothetical protein
MKNLVMILLGILGFASMGIFLTWLMLNLIGHPQEAQEIKDLPNNVSEIQEEARGKAIDGLKDAIVQVDENRKEAVADQQDPNLKNFINMLYLLIIFQLFIGILAAMGLIKR